MVRKDAGGRDCVCVCVDVLAPRSSGGIENIESLGRRITKLLSGQGGRGGEEGYERCTREGLCAR